MKSVSAKFLEAVRGPHQMRAKIEVWANSRWTEIPFTEGSVTVSLGSAVARSLSFSLAPGAVGVDGKRIDASTLDVYASFVRVSRGVVFADGSGEDIPLGIFAVNDIQLGVGTSGDSISVSGSDMFSLVSRAHVPAPWWQRLTTPWYPTNQQTRSYAIKHVINDVLRPSRFTFLPAGGPVFDIRPEVVGKPREYSASFVVEQSREDYIVQMLRAMSAVGYFDGDNRYVIRRHPQLMNEAAVWTVDYGPNGILLDAEISTSREGVFNLIVATTEQTTTADGKTPPVYKAIAEDKNPNSPTRTSGPFGVATRFISSPTWKTQADVNKAAADRLKLSTIAHRQLNFQIVPNPALEPGDRVSVRFPSAAPGNFLITSMTYPLGPTEPISGSCTRMDTEGLT